MHTLFCRCYSRTSVGGLTSGQGQGHRKLTPAELQLQFKNHSNKLKKIRTSLVSVTSSITRVLHIALSKFLDKEPAENIVIVFIMVSGEDELLYHSARRLAESFGYPDPHLFSTEYLAEWEIKTSHVQHSVTLQTLFDRGLFHEWGNVVGNMEDVEQLRHHIGNMLFSGDVDAFEIGLALGFMSRAFGARAPSTQIARAILHDIAKPYFHEDWGYLIEGHNLAKKAIPEVEDLLSAHEGIDTALIDWWLCDEDFVWSLKRHNRWADCARSRLAKANLGDDSYAEHVKLEQAIERAAVECGL